MKSRWIQKVATVVLAITCVLALAGTNGCSRCGPCKEPCVKRCASGCTKPCCPKGATTTTTTEIKTDR